MERPKHIAVACVAGVMFSAVIAASEDGTTLWQPPWWTSRPMSSSDQVLQTSKPFVFLVRKFKSFSAEDEAKRFAAKQDGNASVHRIGADLYQVYFAEALDIRSAIPSAQVDRWTSPNAQFALFLALRQWYRNGDELVNGQLYHYQRAGYATADEAREKTSEFGEIIEWSPKKDSAIVDVRYRKMVDLVVVARPFLEMITLSYSDLIPDHLPPYRTIGPTSVDHLVVGGIYARGKMLTMGYLPTAQASHGASACVMMPDDADGLDHDFARHLVLERGVKVINSNGQRILTSNDGTVCVWKAGAKRYYSVAGGSPEIVDAYLKKFPSVFPAGYSFDRDSWLREEVRRTIGGFRAMVKDDPRDCYLSDYFYLCRFIEPIPGAPVIWPSFVGRKFTVEERAAHFRPVEQWWKQHAGDFSLRKGAPLSHGQMMSLSPREPKAIEAALGIVHASTQPGGSP